jgi:hypothetical protein
VELEGDGPAPRPPGPSVPAGAQHIRVTPENVVALATLFRSCADLLAPTVFDIGDALRISRPWMKDPVSIWARIQLNEYFVDSPNAFARIVQAEYDQHKGMAEALIRTATQYGLNEELAAAGFGRPGHR